MAKKSQKKPSRKKVARRAAPRKMKAVKAVSWQLARSLTTLLAQVNNQFPNRSKSSDGTIGDLAHSARTSDHNVVRGVVHALDITHDPRNGCDSYALAEVLRGARDPRVKYIISNGKIANAAPVTKSGKKYGAWQWSPYTGSNPHDHHVHISVTLDKGDQDQLWQLDATAMPPPAPDAPAPLPVLRAGDGGKDVREAQEALVKHGFLKPEQVDGIFGTRVTLPAVRAFQRKHGLNPDGKIGPQTWKALFT